MSSLIKRTGRSIELASEGIEGLIMKKILLDRFVYFTQGLGAATFAVFIASYALALPSNRVLHGEPIFRIPLSIFGGLFIAATVVLPVLCFKVKTEGQSQKSTEQSLLG
jgi:hypothetical protein